MLEATPVSPLTRKRLVSAVFTGFWLWGCVVHECICTLFAHETTDWDLLQSVKTSLIIVCFPLGLVSHLWPFVNSVMSGTCSFIKPFWVNYHHTFAPWLHIDLTVVIFEITRYGLYFKAFVSAMVSESVDTCHCHFNYIDNCLVDIVVCNLSGQFLSAFNPSYF